MGFFQDYTGAIYDQIPDFTSVGAGLKAISRLSTGQTYLWAELFFTIAGVAATKAQILAQVSNIRVLVDGVVKFELVGTDAVYLAEYYRTNCVANTGILPIFFARPWMEDLRNQDAAAYGLKGIDSLVIEVTLAGGATINAITGYGYTSDNEPLGDHIVVTKLNRNNGSSGLETINDIPLDPDWTMYAMHIVTAVQINLIELLADGARLQYGVPAALNQRLLYTTSPRGVQAGYTPVECTPRNRNADALPLTMNKFQLKITWNAAPGAWGLITEVFQRAPIKGIPNR